MCGGDRTLFKPPKNFFLEEKKQGKEKKNIIRVICNLLIAARSYI